MFRVRSEDTTRNVSGKRLRLSDGVVKSFKFGCYERNEIPPEKLKDVSQEGIEGDVPLGTECNKMDARVIKSVYNGQVAEFGKVFEDHLTERSRVETEKQGETVIHILDDVKSIFKSDTQRRDGKGTPCKRHHDSFMVETKQNGKWPEPNGVSKRHEIDNWLNKCNESMKATMCLYPGPGCHIKPGDEQVKHGKLQTETNSAETSDGESKQHLNLTQLSSYGNEKMGNDGCDITSKIAQNEGLAVTDSLWDGKVVTSSPYSGEASPSFAVNSTTSNEQNMAVLCGKGIPLYLPGQHNWSLRDDTLHLHKHPHLFVNQNEGRQWCTPAMRAGYALGTVGRSTPLPVPWEYFSYITPMKYPVIGSDRGKSQPRGAPESGLASPESGNNTPLTKTRNSRRFKLENQPLDNPWEKRSYSDLITMALASSKENKMTVDEIYRWISMNIPYFRDKGEELSSSGWKNSVRHTLSVRQRFVRLPRVLKGSESHKSWWTLSDDYLRERSGVEPSPLKPTVKATDGKQATQGTQTDELVCDWCASAVVRK